MSPREALNKSIPDLSVPAKQKYDFRFAHKINGLLPLILVAHPCVIGIANKSALP